MTVVCAISYSSVCIRDRSATWSTSRSIWSFVDSINYHSLCQWYSWESVSILFDSIITFTINVSLDGIRDFFDFDIRSYFISCCEYIIKCDISRRYSSCSCSFFGHAQLSHCFLFNSYIRLSLSSIHKIYINVTQHVSVYLSSSRWRLLMSWQEMMMRNSSRTWRETREGE